MAFSFGGEEHAYPTGIVAFFLSFNIFLSITATLGNALILVALQKESTLHPPTKLLFRCLAVTDICVGLISQPFYAVALMSDIITGMNANILLYIGHVNRTSSFILCGVSVFTSTAISVDRLLALLLGLRYRLVVTLRNVRVVVICVWLIGVSLGSMYLWNSSIAFTVFVAFAVLSLVISISCYAKIYLKLQSIATSSSTRPFFPGSIQRIVIRRRNWPDYSTIQEVSFQRILGTAGISCLLRSIYHCGYDNYIWPNSIVCKCAWICFLLYSNPYLSKFVSKPDSLLLEDENSETSCEGHDQTTNVL